MESMHWERTGGKHITETVSLAPTWLLASVSVSWILVNNSINSSSFLTLWGRCVLLNYSHQGPEMEWGYQTSQNYHTFNQGKVLIWPLVSSKCLKWLLESNRDNEKCKQMESLCSDSDQHVSSGGLGLVLIDWDANIIIQYLGSQWSSGLTLLKQHSWIGLPSLTSQLRERKKAQYSFPLWPTGENQDIFVVVNREEWEPTASA